MQTFKNNIDATLKSWPQSPEAWQAPEPEIKFTVSGNRIVHPGDRILCTTKMITCGTNSGSIIDIYYYIEAIKATAPNKIHITDTDVTAIAKRIER